MRGTVYQRKSDLKWVGSVEIPHEKGEKRERKPVYGDTKEEAEAKLNTLLYKIQNGEYAKPNKDTLIGYLKEYHKICAGFDMWSDKSARPKEPKWEETTAALFKMYIDVHFEPRFEKTKLIDVKPSTLDKFYNYKLSTPREYKVMKEGELITKTRSPMSINTVHKLNTFLKAAFNYAIVDKQIKDNPADHVLLAKKTTFKPKIYYEHQFAELLNDVAGTDDEIPIILGGGCGFRRGEMFGIYWRNINFDKKTITIENTRVRFDKNIEKKPKNETSSRTIIVPGYVMSILKLYKIRCKKKGPNDLLITKWKPQPYSEHFKKLLKKYGLPHIRLHDLRHYNAVIMMNKNIPDKVAADRLGHKDVQMLHKVYQHVLTDMDQKAADQIDSTYEVKNSPQVLKA